MRFITDAAEIEHQRRTCEQFTHAPEGTVTGFVVLTVDKNDDIDVSTNACCKKHLMAHLLETIIRLNEWDAPPVQLN